MPDDDDMDVISKRHEVDPVFAEVAALIFGDAVDVRELYDISKMNDTSEVHVPGNLQASRHQKKMAVTGQALGTVAGVAGAHGLYRTLKDGEGAVLRHPKQLKGLASTKGGKAAILAGAGWTGLHVAELGADALGVHANNKLYRQSAKQPKVVSKALTDALGEIVQARRAGQLDTATALVLAEQLTSEVEKGFMARPLLTRVKNFPGKVNNLRPLVRQRAKTKMAEQALKDAPKASAMALGVAAVGGAAAAEGFRRHQQKKQALATPTPPPVQPVAKADDLVDYAFVGEISKMDEDKRLAFGWCSLSEVDGKPVIDLQGDYAPIDEVEKSAYAYVIDSRVGGDMHSRDGERPKHTSDLVESFIATPEKLAQMGLSEEVAKSVPTGWWVGFKVNDDEQWAMVKDGRRAGFSIHGKGSRVSKQLEVPDDMPSGRLR